MTVVVDSAAPTDRYRWIALTNTTLGILMVTINSSIVLISLPAIFRGIHLDPLEPANVSYLLWILQGFLVVSAVLVVSFGRLGDSYGRVRLYNLGFAIFTLCSIGLSFVFIHGKSAALLIIGLRIAQGIGGAMLFANSAAILTDAFPANQRGMALGINSVAAVAGSFIGLLVGGLLSNTDWHLIFLISVPVGIAGTISGYLKLREVGTRQHGRADWWGSGLFAIGLVLVLVGLTYGIQPYGGHTMGWTNPLVFGSVIVGVAMLVSFGFVERRVSEPMLDFALLSNRPFAAGNVASLLVSIGRGGLLFLLVIWLQGIWLPLHGYTFEQTPLWAAIYMLPLTVGFLVAGPVAGVYSDRIGPRPFIVGGLLTATAAFVLLAVLPVDFRYWTFALLLLGYGLGAGAFTSPNSAEIMGSVDPAQRGAAAGIRATGLNLGQTLAISLFFTMLTAGLAARLPHALTSGLAGTGIPANNVNSIAHLPPVVTLFATFLGYNPMKVLLGPVLPSLSGHTASTLTGTTFFPRTISSAFHAGLQLTFGVAAAMTLLALGASLLSGRRPRVAGAPTPRRRYPRSDLVEPEFDLETQIERWRQQAATATPAPLVVTISSPVGTGGTVVAPRLAEQLALPFVDRAIPNVVAERLGVSLASADSHDEQLDRGRARLLTGAANTVPLFGPEVSAEDFDDEDRFRLATEAALWERAATTGGVILGRAAAAILARHPRALHVRLEASPATRLRRMHDLGGYDEQRAPQALERIDQARSAYTQHFYGVDANDPRLYDLIISTDKTDLDAAGEVVLATLTASNLIGALPGDVSNR
jgi:MFS family permease